MRQLTKGILGPSKVNELFLNNKIVVEENTEVERLTDIVYDNDFYLVYRPEFFENKHIVPTKLEEMFGKIDVAKKFCGLFTSGCSFDLYDDLMDSYSPGWHLISSKVVENTGKLNYLEQSVILDNVLRQLKRDYKLKIDLEEDRVFNSKIKFLRKKDIAKDSIAPDLMKLNCNKYRHSFMDYTIDSIILNLLNDKIYNPKNFVWTKDNLGFDEKSVDDIAMIGYYDTYRMLVYAKPDAYFNEENELATTFSIPLR